MPTLRHVVHTVRIYMAGMNGIHNIVGGIFGSGYADISRWAKLAAPVSSKNIRGGGHNVK